MGKGGTRAGGCFLMRSAGSARGRRSVWGRRRGAGCGTRNLVGAAVGVASEDSWNNGATAARILLVRCAAQLRCDALRDWCALKQEELTQSLLRSDTEA